VSALVDAAGLRHGDALIPRTTTARRSIGRSGGTRYQAWTPAASLLFKAQPDLNLYASFGRGFDTPTFDNLAYRSDGVSGLNLDLKAAHTANAEIGAKWRRGGALYARFGLFRSVTRDEIAVESSAGGRSIPQRRPHAPPGRGAGIRCGAGRAVALAGQLHAARCALS
jgi:iron complex outermembrane receptor protein